MNSSCHVNADEHVLLLFFILGCFLTIIGTLLNICSCLIFCRAKSLFKTPYAVFIIALSIADIIKLIAEYLVHLIYLYIQYPYFVCSITWFLTMTSENSSYAFLCALGIERNLKVWTTDRRYLITRRRACLITVMIIVFIFIYDHPFLYRPYNESYCMFRFLNRSIIFSCENAFYRFYGLTFTLTDLIFIENVGLNNFILPILIMSTNLILIVGLRRRAHQRRHRLGARKKDDWRERSVILYMLLSSITFVLLTAPIGILGIWATIHKQKLPTNNLALLLDLLEIIHHCTHFPILLMTSSVIRRKTYQILFQPHLPRQNSLSERQLPPTPRHHCTFSNDNQLDVVQLTLPMNSFSRTSEK